VLAQKVFYLYKTLTRLHETVTKISSKLSKVYISKIVTKIQQKSKPSEALGISTYTNEATNSFLKIREAWFPKLEIIFNHPPLAQLPSSV